MIDPDKLATSYLIVPAVDSLMELSPLGIRAITQIIILYIIRVFIISSPQVKFSHMTKISPTSPNNILPGTPLVFVIRTHGYSQK